MNYEVYNFILEGYPESFNVLVCACGSTQQLYIGVINLEKLKEMHACDIWFDWSVDPLLRPQCLQWYYVACAFEEEIQLLYIVEQCPISKLKNIANVREVKGLWD